MRHPVRADFIAAFDAAVAAADPAAAVRHQLSRQGETILVSGESAGSYAPDHILVVGIGKASVAMAEAACEVTGATHAVVATPYAPTAPTDVTVHVGGHPVPDESSMNAGRALMQAVRACDADALVIAVVSGGGSAAAEVPAAGVSMDDLVALNRWLLASGMPITDMNEVRAAVSGLKAGRLAAATSARVVTLVLSDVVGGGPEHVASGPTIPSGLGGRARGILAGHPDSSLLPSSVRAAVDGFEPVAGTVGPVAVVGSPALAAEAAASHLAAEGFGTAIVTTELGGEARSSAARMLEGARSGTVCIAAGETTVHVTGKGRGGRNQEAALWLAEALDGTAGIFAALGTDGIDGASDAAGAIVDGTSYRAAARRGWDIGSELADNNSYPVLADIGATVTTGPTGTNVCDLWMWWLP